MDEREETREKRRADNARIEEPKPKSRWRHRKGGMYRVIDVCHGSGVLNGHRVVNYASELDNAHYARILIEWHEKMVPAP